MTKISSLFSFDRQLCCDSPYEMPVHSAAILAIISLRATRQKRWQRKVSKRDGVSAPSCRKNDFFFCHVNPINLPVRRVDFYITFFSFVTHKLWGGVVVRNISNQKIKTTLSYTFFHSNTIYLFIFSTHIHRYSSISSRTTNIWCRMRAHTRFYSSSPFVDVLLCVKL